MAPRMGLSESETAFVSWLIREHLTMSSVAFQRDLDDPAEVREFAERVGSLERLQALFVLTVADIRAVGPDVWNGWKAALMRTLYTRTMAVLRGENADDEIRHIEAEAKLRLHKALEDTWSEEEIYDHVGMFYSSYWTGFELESHRRHAAMFGSSHYSVTPCRCVSLRAAACRCVPLRASCSPVAAQLQPSHARAPSTYVPRRTVA